MYTLSRKHIARSAFLYAFLFAGIMLTPLFTWAEINNEARANIMSTAEQQETTHVVVTYKTLADRPTQEEAYLQKLSSGPFGVIKKDNPHAPKQLYAYPDTPVATFEVTPESLATLLEDDAIASIQENRINVTALDSALPTIRDFVLLPAEGVTGTNGAVAIIDTGVDKDHPFLNVVSEACYSNPLTTGISLCPAGAQSSTASGAADTGAGTTCDSALSGCEHGTHVAGIATGKDGTNSLQGAARDADVIAIQVFTKLNNTTTTPTCSSLGIATSECIVAYDSDIISGLHRVRALHDDSAFTHTIGAVNLSLGGAPDYDNQTTCDTDNASTKTAIDDLVAVHIATFVATGNESDKTKINAPSCISSAFGVSALNDNDTPTSFANVNNLADFFAPGVNITSSTLDNTYNNFQGTSMATPVVSGVYTALRAHDSSKTLAQITNALTGTGVSVTDTGTTLPRIDALSAYYALAEKPYVVDIAPIDGDDSTYDTGDIVQIAVTFSSPVSVTGYPTLLLETGATDRFATYTSGSGTTVLTFTYVVQQGDSTPDLEVAHAQALALNNGTIQDTATAVSAGLVVPTNVFSQVNDIEINGEIPGVSNITASPTTATYRAGQSFSVQIQFSEPVTVSGTPAIRLETGATDFVGSYVSGSGTDTLTFTGTVLASHRSTALSYEHDAGALSFPSGTTVQNGSSVDASPTLPFPGGPGSLLANTTISFDSSGPTISRINPSTDTITITNYGAEAVDIASYHLCALAVCVFASTGSVASGSLSPLAPGASVTITGITLDDTASDLGLYAATPFTDPANLRSFIQWGSGGHGYESVADSVGFWSAGTFIPTGSQSYTGNGTTEFGSTHWSNLAVTYSTTTLTESPSNDGSISGSATITLVGDTFTVASGTLTEGTHYTTSNVPSGLSVVITTTSDTSATITFTGNASSHANADDIANMGISFTDSAFTAHEANRIVGAEISSLGVDFTDPVPMISSATLSPALTGLATEGDTITLSFTTDVALSANPSVSIFGNSVTPTGSGNTWSVEYTLTAQDVADNNLFEFSINSLTNSTGTNTTPTTATTDGSQLRLFDVLFSPTNSEHIALLQNGTTLVLQGTQSDIRGQDAFINAIPELDASRDGSPLVVSSDVITFAGGLPHGTVLFPEDRTATGSGMLVYLPPETTRSPQGTIGAINTTTTPTIDGHTMHSAITIPTNPSPANLTGGVATICLDATTTALGTTDPALVVIYEKNTDGSWSPATGATSPSFTSAGQFCFTVDHLADFAISTVTPQTSSSGGGGGGGGGGGSSLTYSTITFNPHGITITYPIDLDEQSVPSIQDFTVKINGEVIAVQSVVVDGRTVQLTLADTAKLSSDSKVLVNYDDDGATPLQQANTGREVRDFFNRIATYTNRTNTTRARTSSGFTLSPEMYAIILAYVEPEKRSQVSALLQPFLAGQATTRITPRRARQTTTTTQATSSWRVLRIGMRGNDVARLQRALNQHMNANLDVDGVFGASTKASVMRFQRNHDIFVDGIAGSQTFSKLY